MTMVIKNHLEFEFFFQKIIEESFNQDKFSTNTMVTILVVGVTSFFVFFALLAVCYRCVQDRFYLPEIKCFLVPLHFRS